MKLKCYYLMKTLETVRFNTTDCSDFGRKDLLLRVDIYGTANDCTILECKKTNNLVASNKVATQKADGYNNVFV